MLGRDLDERQERITLAPYGGILAVLGFLLAALCFYLQVVLSLLPLIAQVGVLRSDLSLNGGSGVVGDPPTDPSTEGTMPANNNGPAISPRSSTRSRRNLPRRHPIFPAPFTWVVLPIVGAITAARSVTIAAT